MTFIHNFIRKEISYFQKLHSDTQKLLLSIFLHDLIGPIISIFTNAFLWRQSHDLILVAVYNLVIYAVIPIGFYLNGLLLKKYSPGIIYFLSVVGGIFVVVGLIFSPAVSYSLVAVLGLMLGLFSGTYWANRNLLTLKTTQSDNRIYFSSLETTSNTTTGVVIPLLIGWFITFGTIVHLYSPVQGYQMIAILMLGIVFILAVVIKTLSLKTISVGALFVKKVSRNWRQFQIFQFIWGINEGAITFIPILLVLILIGQEASLGTVQSASAIVTALLTFAFAKYLSVKHRTALIVIGVFITILGAAFLGTFYSALGVFILVASQNLANATKWIGYSSLNYDLMDHEGATTENHYAYVCDQEIYLNAGRIIGIFLFIVMLHFVSNNVALRFAPFVFAITQIVLITTFKAIEKNLRN